jgi:NIMA (never in mitosis gene a)-related kinase
MSVSQFEILSKLGEGAFSNVFRVRRRSDGNIYALKKVRLSNLGAKERENALNEVRILASISHPNVIAYKEAFIDEGTSTLCIVMEYADSGDLLNLIDKHKRDSSRFTEKEIWDYLIQLLRGLKALHNLSILHRDLKCANVFLTSNGIAKIGDLNVSKVNKQGLAYTQTGTPYYASPEVWRDQPYNSSSDIWSLGCVIYEMTALNPPFMAADMQNLYRKVIKGLYPEIPNVYSTDLSNVIRAMVQVNPSMRPSCEKILEMAPVIRNMNYKKVDSVDVPAELLQTIKFVPSLRMLTNRLPAANYEKRGRGFSAKVPKFDVFGKENKHESPKKERETSEERAGLRLPPYRKFVR